MSKPDWVSQMSKQTTNKSAFIGTTHNINYNIALTYLTNLKKTSQSSLYENIAFGYDMDSIINGTIEQKQENRAFFHYNNFITFHFDLFDKSSWNSLIAFDNVFIGTLLNTVRFDEKAHFLPILSQLFEFLYVNGCTVNVLIPDFVLAGTSFCEEIMPSYSKLFDKLLQLEYIDSHKHKLDSYANKSNFKMSNIHLQVYSYINYLFKKNASHYNNTCKNKIGINSMQYSELDLTKFGSFRIGYYYVLNQIAYYYKTVFRHNIRRVFVPALIQDYEISNSGLDQTIINAFVTKTKNYRGFTFHHMKRSFFSYDKFSQILYYIHLQDRSLENIDCLFADLNSFNSAFYSTKYFQDSAEIASFENTKLYMNYYLYQNSIELFDLGYKNFSWYFYNAYIYHMIQKAKRDYSQLSKNIRNSDKRFKMSFNNITNMNNYFMDYYLYYGNGNFPNSKHFK